MDNIVVVLDVKRVGDGDDLPRLYCQAVIRCDQQAERNIVRELRAKMVSFMTYWLADISPSVDVTVTDYTVEGWDAKG